VGVGVSVSVILSLSLVRVHNSGVLEPHTEDIGRLVSSSAIKTNPPPPLSHISISKRGVRRAG
jgi:hypothetical protein